MKCIRCDAQLEKRNKYGMEVDLCPSGHGMWLDLVELDQLEDRAFDDDELKGTLTFSSTPTSDKCPHCSSELLQFQYRLYDLTLEFCPQDHGYWLDEGEADRVKELMDRREADMERTTEAEQDWTSTLRRLRSPSFFDKVKGLFGG